MEKLQSKFLFISKHPKNGKEKEEDKPCFLPFVKINFSLLHKYFFLMSTSKT